MTPQDMLPTILRVQVIDPAVIVHVMKHPARCRPWGVNELAAVLGCSPGTITHMRTAGRQSFPADLASRFAEAVGCETAVLFTPLASTESDTIREAELVG